MLISNFPRQYIPTKKRELTSFVIVLIFIFSELTTYKYCFFCYFFHSCYVTVLSFQVFSRKGNVSSTVFHNRQLSWLKEKKLFFTSWIVIIIVFFVFTFIIEQILIKRSTSSFTFLSYKCFRKWYPQYFILFTKQQHKLTNKD